MAASQRFSVFGAFPLIAIVVIIYNVIAFAGPALFGTGSETMSTGEEVEVTLGLGFPVPLISGDQWQIGIGDFVLTLGLITLLLETIRSTQTGSTAIANHGFSMLLFAVCLIQFIVLPGFGTSTFFLLMMMTLFDVIAGFTVGIVAARRDFGGGGVVVGN